MTGGSFLGFADEVTADSMTKLAARSCAYSGDLHGRENLPDLPARRLVTDFWLIDALDLGHLFNEWSR